MEATRKKKNIPNKETQSSFFFFFLLLFFRRFSLPSDEFFFLCVPFSIKIPRISLETWKFSFPRSTSSDERKSFPTISKFYDDRIEWDLLPFAHRQVFDGNTSVPISSMELCRSWWTLLEGICKWSASFVSLSKTMERLFLHEFSFQMSDSRTFSIWIPWKKTKAPDLT